jgi:16S rRNA (cytosine967-C5)-methyltransferase
MNSARDYALIQLDRLTLPGWRAHRVKREPERPQDARDLALAEQLRVGVIKNHALLEHLIDHYARRPGRVDPLVRKILALGLYQIRFLTRIPASAAVDQAVEQAKRLGRSSAAGFVNACLRRALREPDVPLPKATDDPIKYATIVLSHPPPLVTRLIELLGVERAIQFCEHDNREPPTIVRLFQGAQLPSDDSIRPHEQPGMFVVKGGKRATFADWAARGIAQVQDPTSARVAHHLDLQPGQDVLDRCAGLGTKTLQIHDLLGGSGWIMAVDPSEPRCKGLRELLLKRQIDNVAGIQASMLHDITELKRPAFDRILVDVPCSNSGVLARRPEARYTQSAEHLGSVTKLQDQIMDDTADYLRPGGRLVYSTCSIWPQENQQRVEHFLISHPDYTLISSTLTWPSMAPEPTRYHDGGYLAILKRSWVRSIQRHEP